MKAKLITKEKKVFNPITISIEITTLSELVGLFGLFNASEEKLKEFIKESLKDDETDSKKFKPDSFNTWEVFTALDEAYENYKNQ